MSKWGKVFWQITTPNLTWAWTEPGPSSHTATLGAGTATSIIELLEDLRSAIASAGGGAWTWGLGTIGYIHLQSPTAGWAPDWPNCSAELLSILGYDGTEIPDGSDRLYANDPHTHGWYPGLTTYGWDADHGAGETVGGDWMPDWPVVTQLAGSGLVRRVGPTRPIYRRDIGFDLLHQDEILDPDRGVHGWIANGYLGPALWVPDRDNVTSAVYTVGDPHEDPRDSSCDAWRVWLDDLPTREIHERNAIYRRVLLRLVGEPG